ncbi:hypothetical protein [Actinomadura algeriensis]|uniref:DUF4352 domain-containing protein n=1 Tax=Actinomadura algeriensis TaxID=1679523 RepID=A0ABR9JSF4_9ACTN|nr:hypothetical protein [Actinomadura algeriensis]MBE1533510.1 hypothetical protein [Actinomadura algeriensis]
MNMDPTVPRRPDGTAPPSPFHDVRQAPSGSPIPPEAPTSPIVHGPPPGWTPEPSGVGPRGEGAGTYRAGGAPREPDAPVSTTGPMGTRETSGVQVRLGTQDGRARRERARAERARAERPRSGKGRRAGFVAAGVVALAGLVMGGVVLSSSTREGDAGSAALGGAERPNGSASAALPLAGTPVEVGTADGSRYRIAAVTAGVHDEAMSSAPSGRSYPYIEYILTNPKDEKVLLDFPGDVFVTARLVAADARGRCMPQAGVPEDMCTPPTKSRVVKSLAGGDLLPGAGGDKWMPPGSSYMVRATVSVPVDRRIGRTDMGLYIWKQLYVSDQLAKPAPFPR